MKEILFRGKCVDMGYWVEGFYVYLYGCKGHKSHRIYTGYAETDCGVYYPDWCEVDTTTVGQYTGLTDKNGKKIFEGDIVQYYGTYALEVFIENGHTKIRWFDTVTKSKCTELFFGHDEEALGEVEVIGNIHDNPELLEED